MANSQLASEKNSQFPKTDIGSHYKGRTIKFFKEQNTLQWKLCLLYKVLIPCIWLEVLIKYRLSAISHPQFKTSEELQIHDPPTWFSVASQASTQPYLSKPTNHHTVFWSSLQMLLSNRNSHFLVPIKSTVSLFYFGFWLASKFTCSLSLVFLSGRSSASPVRPAWNLWHWGLWIFLVLFQQ